MAEFTSAELKKAPPLIPLGRLREHLQTLSADPTLDQSVRDTAALCVRHVDELLERCDAAGRSVFFRKRDLPRRPKHSAGEAAAILYTTKLLVLVHDIVVSN
jgi:hypothetical protein